MKKFWSIFNMLFCVACMLFVLWSTNRTRKRWQELMLMLPRYELKAQWRSRMAEEILDDSTCRVSPPDLYRILSAVWENCEAYDLPKYIMLYVGRKESKFNPKARGEDGEIGVFQILPETGMLIARAYNLPIYNNEELFIIENNTLVAALYLRDLKRMYGLNRALAHYNHGRKGLGKRGQAYARDVLEKAGMYAIN